MAGRPPHRPQALPPKVLHPPPGGGGLHIPTAHRLVGSQPKVIFFPRIPLFIINFHLMRRFRTCSMRRISQPLLVKSAFSCPANSILGVES